MRRKRKPPKIAALQEGRLNRFIARAGVCSRRSADTLIDKGLVKVNGKVVHAYWHKVKRGDKVEVNGKLLVPRPFLYFLLNKPKETITTASDERGRPTVYDLFPEDLREGLFSVGRLDRNTVGVLLFTTDGDLGHRLMHPRYQVDREYVARTRRPLTPEDIQQLREGVKLQDGMAKPEMVASELHGDPRRVGLKLREGRNRQVRRMLEALGHEVMGLERISYAKLTAKGVRRGRWRRLSPREVDRLWRIVKKK